MSYDQETYTIGKRKWRVASLLFHSKDLEPFDFPINLIERAYDPFVCENFQDYVDNYKRVRRANLAYPIIVSSLGEIMDGRHRIIKAMLLGHKTIKAVQFKVDPPCDWWLGE